MQRKDNVAEHYHGTLVRDPYRYLENNNDPDTAEFIVRHATRAESYLGALPEQSHFGRRLQELWNYPKYGVLKKVLGKYYFQKNNGLQNQAVLYRQTALDASPEQVLDPNTFSLDGTIALTTSSVSKDGKFLAFTRSKSGSDWQEGRILNLETNAELEESISHIRFTALAWKKDSSGFFYSRFPDPSTVAASEQSYHNKVYFHRLHTNQDSDQLIFARPDFKELGFAPQVSEDGKYLYLTAWHGTDPENRFYYLDLGAGKEVVRLLDEAEASYQVLGNIGPVFYFLTNNNAPLGRIIAIDIGNPDREDWREVLAEGENAIEDAKIYGEKLVVTYMTSAHHEVKLFGLDGRFEAKIPLPTLGSIVETSGSIEDAEFFFSFTSFLFPSTVYRYCLKEAVLSLVWPIELQFNPDDYETRQSFYPSKDGTLIPLFITHKKGLPLSGKTPTLLYGYGGFNVNMTPGFSVGNLAWMEYGGIYAQACLRGGGEYGENWHRAGMLEKKQNVFDDFHAAAEYLISAGYTTPKHLGISGGSNGGLLVAACMLQRPELYGAVVCRVPVIDMLRYHKFTVGRYWVGEYGNAEANPEHFAALYAYSPLHNVKTQTDYPPTLIMTADTDDRVVPAHAFKFMATLEEHHTDSNQHYLRIERKAGHGAGKPTSKLIAEAADIYSFLAGTLGK